MCGIAGFASLRVDSDDARALCERMCLAIRHRGPDDCGLHVRDGVALGMRRLSIVDIAGGHQPMSSDGGDVVLVFNGEIYNAPALREQLRSEGVAFKTRSDTEVILRLYERDPDRVEELLAGMWAFAIHDRRRGQLVLSRDRFGIKPLFVADAGGGVAFASELQSLRLVERLDAMRGAFQVDPGAAHAMLAWGYVPENETIYGGVRRLAPGARFTIGLRDGSRATKTYWTARPSTDAARVGTLEQACELVEPLLRRSVAEHLESDVPLACFLSGGIDSSLVAAYANDAAARPIQAFSIGFHEARFDESEHARHAAGVIGIPIEVQMLDGSTARDALVDALCAYDEPFGDSSSIATYLISRQVGARFKVALAGDGGDEVFAGYRKHSIVRMRASLDRVPHVRAGMARVLDSVPMQSDRSRGWTELLRTLHRVGRGLHGDDAGSYVALTQLASLDRAAAFVRAPSNAQRFESDARVRFENASGSVLQRTQACDLMSPLPNDMLTKVDRASMACHLEVRVPFLDHRVVEAGLGLPQRFSLGRSGKAVLRALHARRFGPAAAARKKKGFDVPVERWFETSLVGACDALFDRRRIERDGIFSPTALADGRWRKWVATDAHLLWNAFALAAWCELAHGDGADALRATLDGRPERGPEAPGTATARR